jgi:hypothetical protein
MAETETPTTHDPENARLRAALTQARSDLHLIALESCPDGIWKMAKQARDRVQEALEGPAAHKAT